MRVNDFLFALIDRYVPMPKTEQNELYGEITADYNKIIINPESEHFQDNWKVKAKQFFERPYVRLALAILFIPACKWIVEFMKESDESEEKHED